MFNKDMTVAEAMLVHPKAREAFADLADNRAYVRNDYRSKNIKEALRASCERSLP